MAHTQATVTHTADNPLGQKVTSVRTAGGTKSAQINGVQQTIRRGTVLNDGDVLSNFTGTIDINLHPNDSIR